MPHIQFKAFLSCSLEENDQELVAFFGKLIKSFGIDPEAYDYQDVGRIPDDIKERIIRSDCLIAIATRRKKIEGSDNWTCPDWIQHEIALANAYNKPIAIFVEDNVGIDGFIAMEERREKFARNNLAKNIDKIATFLFNLRKHLESVRETGVLQAPVLMRHYIHTKEEILSRDLTVVRVEVLLESLIEGLEATHHFIDKEETTPGVSVKPQEFDFKCKEMPAGTKVEPKIVLDTDFRFLWNVSFSPPLKRGEKVKYAYKEVFSNYRPYTYEELLERIGQGTYEYREPICEACEWTITHPTYELKSEFEFPEDYEIENYYPYVVSGVARQKVDDEIRRIKEGNMFAAEKIFDKWVLRLEVPKPIQGCTYYTYYVPPKAG